MRSLATKFTLAFLLIGVLGIVIFALLLGVQARTEFNRFLSSRDEASLINGLERYYVLAGSWQGLAPAMDQSPPMDIFRRVIVVADAGGRVVMGNRDVPDGAQLSAADRARARELVVNGQVVGLLVPPTVQDAPRRGPAGGPLEADLWDRLLWVALLSAVATTLVALAVGLLLARTLTRPVAELTAATRAMAAGNLHQQVTVRSRDEVGELAGAFNQMSADLARASTLRKQMTADLAHDLRTPLSVLSGYAEGLKEGRLQGSPPIFNIMHDEVLHLQRLVEDLRTLSLADAGELPLNRRLVDPAALVERAALAHLVPAEARGLTLSVDSEEDLPSVLVDTDRMAQVLNNLVTNALRHTSEGCIVLGARRRNGQVALAVQDTGAGIAPEDLPFVFDRLYRGDKARQRTDEASSGLGLAIARAIVEAHGGSIEVLSTPGQGSTFSVLLPAAA